MKHTENTSLSIYSWGKKWFQDTERTYRQNKTKNSPTVCPSKHGTHTIFDSQKNTPRFGIIWPWNWKIKNYISLWIRMKTSNMKKSSIIREPYWRMLYVIPESLPGLVTVWPKKRIPNLRNSVHTKCTFRPLYVLLSKAEVSLRKWNTPVARTWLQLGS